MDRKITRLSIAILAWITKQCWEIIAYCSRLKMPLSYLVTVTMSYIHISITYLSFTLIYIRSGTYHQTSEDAKYRRWRRISLLSGIRQVSICSHVKHLFIVWNRHFKKVIYSHLIKKSKHCPYLLNITYFCRNQSLISNDTRPAWMRSLHSTATNWLAMVPEVRLPQSSRVACL